MPTRSAEVAYLVGAGGAGGGGSGHDLVGDRPMINFLVSKDLQGLYVRITPGYSLDGVGPLDFYRAGTSSIETLLLERHLDKLLWSKMEEVRRVSYLRGWRDAKAHKVKSTSFPKCVDVLDWERKDAGL